MRRRFWLLFGGIWALGGFLILVIGGAMVLADRELASDGRSVEGIVLTKDIIPADSDSSTRYRVRYRFTTEAGETIEGASDVGVDRWEALEERGAVAIRYLPARPAQNGLDGAGGGIVGVIFLLLGALFGSIGTVLVVLSLRQLRTEGRLLRTGHRATATVTGVEETKVSFNRRQQFRLRYRYEDAAGRAHHGRSGYLDWSETVAWPQGSSATVRYDPAQPDTSLWVGVEEPELAHVDAPSAAESGPG